MKDPSSARTAPWDGMLSEANRRMKRLVGYAEKPKKMQSPLKHIKRSHSALIYNLNHTDFDNEHYGRDEYGRFKDGGWGRANARTLYGKDIWNGYRPPMFACDGNLLITDGAWHGATDIIAAPQDFYAIADGIVRGIRGRGSSGVICIQHYSVKGDFWAVYRHVVPCVKIGDKVKMGDKLGTLYDWGSNTHLHLEIHSPEKLWDLERISNDESKGFYIWYKVGDKIRSQMSTSWLRGCGLTYPFYSYVGLKLIEHWQ